MFRMHQNYLGRFLKIQTSKPSRGKPWCSRSRVGREYQHLKKHSLADPNIGSPRFTLWEIEFTLWFCFLFERLIWSLGTRISFAEASCLRGRFGLPHGQTPTQNETAAAQHYSLCTSAGSNWLGPALLSFPGTTLFFIVLLGIPWQNTERSEILVGNTPFAKVSVSTLCSVDAQPLWPANCLCHRTPKETKAKHVLELSKSQHTQPWARRQGAKVVCVLMRARPWAHWQSGFVSQFHHFGLRDIWHPFASVSLSIKWD